MNKPEKIKLTGFELTERVNEIRSYNQAIDDYEKWLPSEKELQKIQSGLMTYWSLYHAISIRLYPEGYIARELKKTNPTEYHQLLKHIEDCK